MAKKRTLSKSSWMADWVCFSSSVGFVGILVVERYWEYLWKYPTVWLIISIDLDHMRRRRRVPGPLRPLFADAAGPILHQLAQAQTSLEKEIGALRQVRRNYRVVSGSRSAHCNSAARVYKASYN
jgi:hypothetical protein